MNDEIGQAFAPLNVRAEAAASPGHDRISLRDYVKTVEIGAFEVERGTTQRLRFNVVVEVPQVSQVGDDVDQILSYDRITEAIDREFTLERLNLLETLAERIAQGILADPLAHRVFVRIEKLDRGPYALGVEIMREHQPETSTPAAQAVQPRVLYLSNAALVAPDLGAWIDRLQAQGEPVLLCVDQPAEPAPKAIGAQACRHIALLALDQNAQVLAARDDRCVARASRTELDWALAQGGISVWAPAKMVLDAFDGPQQGVVDARALAVWFAGQMQAVELIFVGAPLPEHPVGLPCRAVSIADAARSL